MTARRKLVYFAAPAAVVIGGLVAWYTRDDSASDAPARFSALGLGPGMTVADIGAGGGTLSIMAARSPPKLMRSGLKLCERKPPRI